ncbi:hypothetical protein GIB67_002150 [Kingdonia uniflora]|uniref:Uncharacterized protein n=1 Tax=Kingdonia uniflora TaxID=39325 RepID=A0A7J7KWJ5_9MAGN|nr:hypothetical protein GIB67_002150 [Kingdonia uniflora]
MTSVNGNKKGTNGERRVNLPNAPGVDCVGLPESITSSKLARTFPKWQMLKRPSALGTTGSSEPVEKRRGVKPKMSGMKVVDDRLVVEDDWKEVEENARLAALHKEEEMSRMAARLMKGICLGVEEEKAERKRKKAELERNIVQLKFNLSKEGKRMEALEASQVVEINKRQVEVKMDLEKVVAERDRLGRHLMSKGYSEDEVDAIRADTYVEEDEDEETKVISSGIVDGLDSVYPQMVRDFQGDDNERPELENDKELKDIRLRIKDFEVELAVERETSASLLSS